MKITEIIKSLFEAELMVHEARELIVEIATDISGIISKIAANSTSNILEIDSSIDFLEGFIKRALKEFTGDSSPDADFIRNEGVELLKQIKQRRSLI